MFNLPVPPQVSRWSGKNISVDAACIAPDALMDRLTDWFFIFHFAFLQSSLHSIPVPLELIKLAPVLFRAGGGWGRGGVPFIGAFPLDGSSSHCWKRVCVASFAPESLWPLTGKNTLAWPFHAVTLFFHCISFNSALIEENLLEAALQTLHCGPPLPSPHPPPVPPS